MTVAAWRPDFGFYVAFNADPNDPNAVPTWTDLTVRLRKAGSVKRGRQYELDQNLAAQVNVTLDDPDEYLNPANTASPYYPNVVPYRQVLWQACWPNPCSGNLLNTGYGTNPQLGTTAGYDTTFDSYANGGTVGWVTAVGATSPVVTTTTPFQGTQDLTWTVVSGATVQGVSLVVPCMPGRQYTTSAYVRQTTASTQQISVVGGATGTSTASTGAYVRLSVTFTATQPTHTIQIATTGTAVAGTINLDALQHEQAAAASTFTTAGSVIYGVFRGYVERWPAEWDHVGYRGRCEVILVDAFAPLSQIPLESEYRNSLLAKAPLAWWPLSEPATATTFADASGNNAPSLGIWSSANGVTTPLAPGTTLSSAISGDPGASAVKFTADLVNINPNQKGQVLIAGPQGGTTALTTGVPATPITSWSATLALWINTSTAWGSYAIGPVLAAWKNSLASPGADVAIGVTYGVGAGIAAQIQTTSNNGGTTAVLQALSSTVVTDGRWHLVIATASQDATTSSVAVYVDGTQVASASTPTSGFPLLGTSCTTVELGGAFGASGYNDTWDGTAAHLAVWNRVLSPTEIADLVAAGKGYTGETSGARIRRYLGYGWTGPTSIDTGSSTMGVSGLTTVTTVTGATSTLTGCQDTTTSENGNLWVDADGNFTFAARSRRYNVLTSQYTFGENAAGGEYPYEDGVKFGMDATFAYNAVEVDNLNGISAISRDTTTQKRFFPRGYQRNVNLASDNEAIDAANWILSTHKTPVQRVAQIVLEPSSKGTSLWPVVLGLELGQRVTVKRRAKAGGLTMSADYFVESIEHGSIDMTAGGWRTTLLLSPAFQAQVWILGDATYGVLGSTTILGY